MAALSNGVVPAIEEGKLDKFKLTGVSETGRELGRGSYATVVELKFRGLRCAGKKLHGLYDELSESEKQRTLNRFTAECQLLSDLKHPNVVQFLGIHVEEGSPLPVLVMEIMYTTLSRCIDRHKSLPNEMCYSILKDVATALCYLHNNNPPVIHRDMSANNVLLTSNMTAKLADLGTAKILDLTPAIKSCMSTCPGTIAYMPPEALCHDPEYSTDIDCFSYGVLIIHILSGEWPIPDVQVRRDRESGTSVTLSEMARREKYLTAIKQEHPLMYSLVHDCLSDKRPSADEILSRVSEAVTSLSSMESSLELLQRNQALAVRLQEADERVSDLQQSFRDQLSRTANQYDQEMVHIIENAEKRAESERELIQSQLFEEREEHKKWSESLSAEKGELEAEMEQVKTSISLEATQLRGDVHKLAADNVKLQRRLSSAEDLSAIQTKQITAVYKAFTAKEKQLATTNKEIHTNNKILQKKKKEVQVLQQKNTALQQEQSAGQQNLSLIRGEMELLQKQNSVLLEQQKELQILAEVSQEELLVKQEENVLLQEELALVTDKQEALQQELVHKNSFVEAKKLEVDLLKTCEIPTLESDLEMKEDTIKIMKKQLKHTQDFLATQKDTPLNFSAKFQVKSCAELPVAMSDPQCTVVNDTAYVGGGLTDNKSGNEGQGEVFEYNQLEDKWNTLPACPTRRFGLAPFRGKVLTIGGLTKSNIPSGSVYTFNHSTKTWEEDPIPPLPTKRFFPAVVSIQSVLAVCGGVAQGGSLTDNVEVFKDRSWHVASRLPYRCALAKPVIIGDSCYLMGGYFSLSPDVPSKAVISLPLSGLISHLEGEKELVSSWEFHSDEECRITQYKATPANCGGVLLAIGGWDQNNLASKSDILVYSFRTGMWVKVKDLPSPRSGSTATTQLQNGSILIAGGFEEGNKKTSTTLLLCLTF